MAQLETTKTITIFGDQGQRQLELAVTQELLELLDLTAIINSTTPEQFHYSFTGLIIALRYGKHGISAWFQQQLTQQNVAFAAILSERGIKEDQLSNRISAYELPLAHPDSFYPKGQRTATTSASTWIGVAKELAEKQQRASTGLRHLVGA